MNIKKVLSLAFAMLMLFSITACAGQSVINETNKGTTSETAASSETSETGTEADYKTNEADETAMGDSKTLIAYFSLPETEGDAAKDSTITVDGETLGNTEYVARLIQEATGADVFRIEAQVPYTIDDHDALIDYAKQEQTDDARPAISDTIDNFENYDTVFIGYPIWWSDLPMIMYTFLESYDFSGKDVYLFSTNGGSGLADTVNTITEKLNDTNVNENAFQLHRNDMETAPDEVSRWLGVLDLDL